MKLNNYANATLVRITALALNALGTLLLFPYILHTLGENEFGIWSLSASITGYLLLVDFGISVACTRFLSLSLDDKSQWKHIVSNSIALSLVLMAILCLSGLTVLVLSSLDIYLLSNTTLNNVIGILCIEAGISLVLKIFVSIMRAQLKYLELGVFEVLRVLLRLIGLPAILYLGGNVYHLIIYSALINILFFSCSVIYVKRENKTFFLDRSVLDFSRIKELFDFGKYAILVQTSELFRYRLDSAFVGIAMGLSSVAHYAIIITVVDMAVQILSRFLSYWETIIIRHIGNKDHDLSLRYLFKSLSIGSWVSAFFIFNFYLIGEVFLTLWVGEKYNYLASDLLLLSAVLLLVTFQMSITPFLNGHGKQKTDALLTVIEVISKVSLAFPFLHLMGFKGIMLATLLPGLVLSFTVRLSLLASLTGTTYSKLLLRYLKQVLPLSGLIALMFVVNQLLAQTGLGQYSRITIIFFLQAVMAVVAVVYYLHHRKLSDTIACT